MKKELLNGLTEEQIAKVKACKNQEELLKLAKEEGVELTGEQLEAVNGGTCVMCESQPESSKKCPLCGTKSEGKYLYRKSWEGIYYRYTCPNCGNVWEAYD